MSTSIDVQSYLKKVEKLKQVERTQRYDHDRISAMGTQEARANMIFETLRNKEVAELWEQEGNLDYFAGMNFHGAREHGLGAHHATDIWRIIQKMPKGALLHCHFDGTVDTRFLIEAAKRTPMMAMRSNLPLSTPEALFQAAVDFLVIPESETRSNVPIYSPDYVPGTWVSFATARNSFPYPHPYLSDKHTSEDQLPAYLFPLQGDRSDAGLSFDAYIHSLMTLTPHPGTPPITNSKQAWAKFQSTFVVARGLIGYEPTLKAYVKELLLSHHRDGISYTEVRLNFLDEFMVRTNGQFDLNHEEWVKIFIQATEEIQSEIKDGSVIDAKIIYSTVRFIDSTKLRWYLEDCINLKKKFSKWIVGFDLVGHEDPLIPLRQYIPELLRFKARCVEENVEIPFVFHAGETLEDGGDADLNLYDAIVLETKRIGHGVSLARHPVLMDVVKERNICVEICPISNQILGYTASIASHPSLLALLNRNVPVALSSDDPSIFENFGLSYDFYQLVISSKSTTLVSLQELARRSITFALCDAGAKASLLRDFDTKWEAFFAWFMSEYADRLKQ